MNTQRGGTLLGLIIGALIGLGAALAVAVYITKVPVPFMNKSQARNPDSDAVEAKKNKDWNPNAPLAGKNQPKPPPAPAAETPGAPVPDPAVAAVPKAAASAAAKATKPAADPLGDLAKAKVEGLSSGPGVDPFSYFIQAGAFRTPEDAEQQRARLSLLGMQAKVTEREQAGRTVYRVRLGPFDKKEDADKVKERLDNNSIETALVRVQR
ncbi:MULTISPECIES: SPOR domain-containing protein [unclassified Polaromonas]|uniref:SPOR domain-containing protein n=1 Tax=unclassified Polaromonas TaxID=2638319 RepID=UPI000F09328A|nr:MULTISPECIES: SPOR domain-containing protein [unclassified Polaromonas]AYQ28030.1 sporulation protein [Polaromonas sp. SP1]QGJ17108.1 sporulation protein [Polaromonas sp. Pch-P]